MSIGADVTLLSQVVTTGKAIREIIKSVSNADTKEKLNDIYDSLMELKHTAAELEDENRSLKEKLRFKGDDFQFRNPFWFEKKTRSARSVRSVLQKIKLRR
jgi:hypothetical protein